MRCDEEEKILFIRPRGDFNCAGRCDFCALAGVRGDGLSLESTLLRGRKVSVMMFVFCSGITVGSGWELRRDVDFE